MYELRKGHQKGPSIGANWQKDAICISLSGREFSLCGVRGSNFKGGLSQSNFSQQFKEVLLAKAPSIFSMLFFRFLLQSLCSLRLLAHGSRQDAKEMELLAFRKEGEL